MNPDRKLLAAAKQELSSIKGAWNSPHAPDELETLVKRIKYADQNLFNIIFRNDHDIDLKTEATDLYSDYYDYLKYGDSPQAEVHRAEKPTYIYLNDP